MRPTHDLPSAFRPTLPSQSAIHYLASSSPSKHRDKAPVLITFEDWDKGGIFDWYRAQPRTAIHKLELRKERDRFKHEFVTLYLDGGRAYRIDRRPMGGPNAEVILSKGCEAEDSVTELGDDGLKTIRSDTDVKISVQFHSKKKLDLYAVIAICVSVRMDPDCVQYTLQLYNCYFLARTITTLVVRHYLIHCRELGGLRWDALTESAVSDYMFPGWSVLDREMRKVLIELLEEVIWPIVKKEAELLVQKQKLWRELKKTTKGIIQENMATVDHLVVEAIRSGVLRWALDATLDTLWHDGLEHNLSNPDYQKDYEVAVEDTLTKMVKVKLHSSLPSNMVTKLDGILPKRLFSRLPSSLLALLPAEIWARIPAYVLEKAPDDAIVKAPADLLTKAPDEFIKTLPTEVFARSSTPQQLTLPDDLNRLPQRLLDVALSRMCTVLEQSTVDHERSLAFKLLRRLPDDILKTIPQNIRDMREEAGDNSELSTQVVIANDDSLPSTHANVPRRSSPKGLILEGYRLVVRCGFDGIVRLAPDPILEHIPGFTVELIPKSMLKAISADTLARLPPGFLARLRLPFLEKIPQELLEKLPETLLKNLPRKTLERLPDGLLDRLPEQLLRNIPVELMENLPENLSDLVHQAITNFEGQKVTIELANRTCAIMKAALRKSQDELPNSVIRIVVESRSKMRHQQLATHQEFQQYILKKTRKHNKTVAKSPLRLDEEVVYNPLRQKTEDVWRVMRLHSSPQTRLSSLPLMTIFS